MLTFQPLTPAANAISSVFHLRRCLCTLSKTPLTLLLLFSAWYAESSCFQFSSNARRLDLTAVFFSITALGSLVVGSFANSWIGVAYRQKITLNDKNDPRGKTYQQEREQHHWRELIGVEVAETTEHRAMQKNKKNGRQG